MAKNGIPNEVYLKAVELYNQGYLMKQIVKEIGVSDTSIYKWALKNNISLRNDHGRKNFFDKNFFKEINNEKKAYWLGVGFADGSITRASSMDKKPNRFTINISSKDRDLLEKFNRDLQSTYEIYDYIPSDATYASNQMSKVVINSVELAQQLHAHGLIENKSHLIEFPFESLDESLYRHFIRGYFDGDGTVAIDSFGIIGPKNFLETIQKILMEELCFNKTKLKPEKSGLFTMRYGGNKQLKTIFNYLYDDSSVYLDRKYNEFLSLLS